MNSTSIKVAMHQLFISLYHHHHQQQQQQQQYTKTLTQRQQQHHHHHHHSTTSKVRKHFNLKHVQPPLPPSPVLSLRRQHRKFAAQKRGPDSQSLPPPNEYADQRLLQVHRARVPLCAEQAVRILCSNGGAGDLGG